MDRIVWYLASIRSFTEMMPLVQAALACGLLYQMDLALNLSSWLLRKMGVLSTSAVLEPENRRSAVVVLPTLLRKRSELEGLVSAMRSIASNGYPAKIYAVACIDGIRESAGLYRELAESLSRESLPEGVTLHVTGTRERCGKAVAMDSGVEYVERLVEAGRLPRFPDLFFNMDADSVLGEGTLERMAYRLTRKRWLLGVPHQIVTSNVVVPLDQCYTGWRSLLRWERWIALLVAREYLSAITVGKINCKLFPCTEVSGALYCTWSEIYQAAPRYARFMQSLKVGDWLKWWLGYPPPQFSEFHGAPLPQALTGPGDDTWMGWFAAGSHWRDGRPCFEFPRTPIHALARFVLEYFSRPVAYDPLAKVYSKTPTTARSLFKQRLRWNSSRIQDLLRFGKVLAYNWSVGVPLVLATVIVFTSISFFAVSPLALLYVSRAPPAAVAFTVLAAAGYAVTRITSTVTALIISDSPRGEWIKLVALPFAGVYHVVFNTVTLIIGYYRDTFGFGEPTTFAPEATLLESNLSRVAIAYRLRRALLLAARSARFGDVPFGKFWFGWKESRYTPSGFQGWSTGKSPPAVFWPAPSPKGPPTRRGNEARRRPGAATPD